MNNSRVLISILNWNGGVATLEAVRAVNKSKYTDFAIIIIDNGSTDSSVDLIQREFPKIKILKNSVNLGFASGQNQGINFAKENCYEFVWILNNDTKVAPSALGFLIDEFDQDGKIGMVSPIIIDDDADEGLQFCGCSFDAENFKFDHFKAIDEAIQSQKTNAKRFCIWGTAILARTEVVSKLGGFDDKFFAYYEDLDLSVRLINEGYLNRVVPAAVVRHSGFNQADLRPAHYSYFNTRNRFIFWDKHVAANRRLGFYREFMAGALIFASVWREKGDRVREQATLLAIWDGVRKVGGPWDKDRHAPKIIFSPLVKYAYFFADILRDGLFLKIRRLVSGRGR